MTEPNYEDFEDPKDYLHAKVGFLQARVWELEEALAGAIEDLNYEGLDTTDYHAALDRAFKQTRAALREKP